ncbi:hypothetical protein [Pradoshia sp.]
MIKVSYHVLGSAVYLVGLVLILTFPGQKSMVGIQLFEAYSWPSEGLFGLSNIWLLAVGIQFIGVLLLVKWFTDKYPSYRKKYQYLEPFILMAAVILPSIGVNSLFKMGEEVYAYSGQSGAGAVQYVQEDSSCTERDKEGKVECSIVLRNFEHHSQQINLVFELKEGITEEKVTTAYLQKHERKVVKVSFSPEELKNESEVPAFHIES